MHCKTFPQCGPIPPVPPHTPPPAPPRTPPRPPPKFLKFEKKNLSNQLSEWCCEALFTRNVFRTIFIIGTFDLFDIFQHHMWTPLLVCAIICYVRTDLMCYITLTLPDSILDENLWCILLFLHNISKCFRQKKNRQKSMYTWNPSVQRKSFGQKLNVRRAAKGSLLTSF